MKERLLTVDEIKKLIKLGYFENYGNDENTAWITYKTETEFENKVYNYGYFNIDDLEKYKNDKFVYPEIIESYNLRDGFKIVNYKFYYFWKNILDKKNNFKEIEL